MRASEETFNLPAGGPPALESNVKHHVDAVEASVFRLTVAKCEARA